MSKTPRNVYKLIERCAKSTAIFSKPGEMIIEPSATLENQSKMLHQKDWIWVKISSARWRNSQKVLGN